MYLYIYFICVVAYKIILSNIKNDDVESKERR